MTKFEDNVSPYLSFVEGSAPSSPAATNFKLYYDSADHLLKWKNSAGSVTTIATGAASAGALVFLEAHTASSSAQLDFTTFISSTYDDYLIEGIGLLPATNNAALNMRIGTGGTPTYDTGANYYSSNAGYGSAGAAINHANAAATAFTIAWQIPSATAYGHCSFSIHLSEPQNSAHNRYYFGTAAFHDGTAALPATVGGLWVNAADAITAVRFLFSSGNIASGVIRVYGIAKS